ncbi:hypothetical protein CNMCM5623_007778 [Aspergillus felis]|uniref:Uncharacterized protein n=1 Tax=Aspergillus felis TaxID=1287682 RepID=A0A8H6PYI6_9EURO|nr:hypothetical protein CNMCM5623_007778 [Aspergillus felis]
MMQSPTRRFGDLRLALEKPFFALSGSGGLFNESTVEFSVEQQHNPSSDGRHKVLADDSRARAKRAKLTPTVSETFLVSPPSSMGSRILQNNRFGLIEKASLAWQRPVKAASEVIVRAS